MSPQARRLREALLAHGVKVRVRTNSRVITRQGARGREYGDADSGLFDPAGVDLHALAADCSGTVYWFPEMKKAFASSQWPGGRVVEVTWHDPGGVAVHREVPAPRLGLYYLGGPRYTSKRR